jgi:hypothetical protein
MRRLGAAIVAAALAFAGCIGAAAQGAPAMEHRSTADEQAYAEHEDAELLGVNAAEANESWSDRGDGWSPNASMQEDRIGDGGAPFWVYEYRLPNATLQVVVDEDGEVVAKERDDDVDEDQPAITDWEISSIEAVDIVQENTDAWTVDDDGMAFYHLEREEAEKDPIWSMAQFREDGLQWARVNATTGEFLGSGSMDGGDGGWSGWGGWGGGWGSGSGNASSDDPYPEGDSFQGTVSVSEPTAEHTCEVEQPDHPELGVELTLDDPATSTVTATVEGPSEELGTIEATADEPAAAEWWDDPSPGDYTVTVELQEGAAQDYTITWCAEGETYEGSNGPYGPDETGICDEVDGER